MLMAKYTAIYEDCWMSGSHMHKLTRFEKFETIGTESVGDALRRLNIQDSTVYLFNGHPTLVGEKNENKNLRTA